MKKFKYLFFLLMIFLLIPICVNAKAKEVATCTYSVPFEVYVGFRQSKTVNVTFTITVNDDGSLEYSKPENMDIIPDEASEEGHRWHYELNSFSKNVYDNNKVSSECPVLASYTDNNDVYNIFITDSNTESNLSELGYPNPHTLTGVLKAEPGVEVDTNKSKDICPRPVRLEFDPNVTVNIRFFLDKDGQKKFEVTNMNTGAKGDAYADGGLIDVPLSANNWVFYMDTENMDPFYESKDSCENAELYLSSKDGKLSQNVYITNKRPSDENNFGLTKDGSDYQEDQGSWNPNTTCADGSCNINITEFCNNPYVARTLKFLGIILAIAKIIIPALIIGLGFVDLAKIVISGKVEDAKKQGMNIIKRVIIGIVIFLIPTILITIYNVAHSIASDSEVKTDGQLDIPTDFKNCVGCILDANNKEACVINTGS